jgi:hypothetical protein
MAITNSVGFSWQLGASDYSQLNRRSLGHSEVQGDSFVIMILKRTRDLVDTRFQVNMD